jgi:adenosine deaminase
VAARSASRRSLSKKIQSLKKVELHQHVDGSIPPRLAWKLMSKHGIRPVDTYRELERLLVLQDHEAGSLLSYLDKFHYPLWITQFYDNIATVVDAMVIDAYRHGVRVLELRYSPIIHTLAGLTIRQTISAALAGMNRARRRVPIQVGLIIIAMRQHGPHIAKLLARQAVSEAYYLHDRSGVIGFDIAGAEKGNPPKLFREAYAIAHSGRLGLTAHVGEDEGPAFIWQAVDELGVSRIGHGCSAVRDRELLKRLARDRIAVECCLTSNYQTGAVRRGEEHPILTFLERGIPVAICTDNTTVSDTSQERENRLLADRIHPERLQAIHQNAVAHSFIGSLNVDKPFRLGG